MKKSIIPLLALLLIVACYDKSGKSSRHDHFPVLDGPYLGQELPDTTPVLFASGIISNGQTNRDVAITPDGNEMYFGIHSQSFLYSSILVSNRENGRWTEPEVASFAVDPRYSHLEPSISGDGNTIFFLSNHPKDSSENPGDEDIWAVDRKGDGWSDPYNIGAPVNTYDQEFYPSVTKEGTLYFTRLAIGQRVHYIYRSKWNNGKFEEPELLPEQVNCGQNRFNAYIAPDESFMVIPAIGVEDNVQGINYYLVKRNEDDTWREPVNLGSEINKMGNRGYSFSLSPDGKYAFFMASRPLADSMQPKALSYDFFSTLSTSPRNGNSDIYWFETSNLMRLMD